MLDNILEVDKKWIRKLYDEGNDPVKKQIIRDFPNLIYTDENQIITGIQFVVYENPHTSKLEMDGIVFNNGNLVMGKVDKNGKTYPIVTIVDDEEMNIRECMIVPVTFEELQEGDFYFNYPQIKDLNTEESKDKLKKHEYYGILLNKSKKIGVFISEKDDKEYSMSTEKYFGPHIYKVVPIQ